MAGSAIYTLFRSLARLDTGKPCRLCDEQIPTADHFGRSEGICKPCRSI